MKRGLGNTYCRNGIWWIHYSAHGIVFRESSRSHDEKDAIKLLKQKIADAANGKILGSKAERVTLADMFEAVRADYADKGNRSTRMINRVEQHLFAYFGKDARAVDLTRAKIQKYVEARKKEMLLRVTGKKMVVNAKTVPERILQPPSNATINGELRFLRRAFRLLVDDDRLNRAPKISLISEPGARQGFIEDDQFKPLRDALPDYLRDPITFLYLSGWRKSALRYLEWNRDVELTRDDHGEIAGGKIYLQAAFAKNKTTWKISISGEITEIIKRAWAGRKQGCGLVFHHGGSRIGDFRKAWRNACAAAKLHPIVTLDAEGKLVTHKRLIHDLRRSAVRNLVRSGVSERVAMSVTQHKTRSVFDRYNITSDSDREDAMAKRSEDFNRVPV